MKRLKGIGGRLYLLAAAGLLLFPAAAGAELPYRTFAKDGYGAVVEIQPAYYPAGIVGNRLTAAAQDGTNGPEEPGDSGDPGASEDPAAGMPETLSAPQDLFIDDRDHLFIADTGNNRIVELDARHRFVRQITVPDSPLSKPEGVFVDAAGELYVADTGNARVVRLSREGELLREYGAPVSPYIPSRFVYDPIKVVADGRGYLYILSRGGYAGLLQLSPDGEFQRFFGANPTPFSAVDAFKRAVYSREMYANERSKLPPPADNVAIDGEGMIYTVTGQDDAASDRIKKLNYKGVNILAQSGKFGAANRNFGEETGLARYQDPGAVKHVVDVAVDRDGNLTVIDDGLGYVSHYDAGGELLYFWGGKAGPNATQLGLMRSPAAVEVDSKGTLYILDDEENAVQTFRPTEFGELVLEASRLDAAGRNAESGPLWERVGRMNAVYAPALTGVAQAAYDRGDFRQAADLFRKAGSPEGFSAAFWQIRIGWFQERFSQLATAGIGAVLAWTLLNRATRSAGWRVGLRRRRGAGGRLAELAGHLFYLLRHPIDGFGALRYENKGSFVSGLAVLAAALASYAYSAYGTSFSFNPVLTERIGLASVVGPFALVWSGWVVCNYLVSSINRGEGRFRDVFIGSCYALVPFALIGFPLAALSNVLTLSEGAIYHYMQYGMYAWVGLLFFCSVKALQNYQVGETTTNILYTLLAMVVLGVLVFIVIGLTGELRTFVTEVYREVLLR